MDERGRLAGIVTGPFFAAAVLLLFWLLMAASLKDKSPGFDEVLHATAGYSYWRYGDYGLQPENGNLPQRLAGLPLALGAEKPPATLSEDWRDSQVPVVAYDWFYGSGNNATRMTAEGRIACGALAVLLGAVVWAWSRRLFGPWGGLVSLILYVLSPTVLANGALMTSDMAAALFFLAATWAWWAVLQRASAGRVLCSALLVAGLFVSKMSAVLILPVMAVLLAARLVDGGPLPFSIGGWRGKLSSRGRQALVLSMACAVHVVVGAAVVWSFYGFRFSAFPDREAADRFQFPWQYVLDEPGPPAVVRSLGLDQAQSARAAGVLTAHGASGNLWSYEGIAALTEIRQEILTPAQARRMDAFENRPPPGLPDNVIDFFRRHKLLPEADLYGFATVLLNSQSRRAFWNGETSEKGWAGFFPYTFLVKTPLGVFGICGLALAAGWISLRTRSSTNPVQPVPGNRWTMHPTLPLWVLLAVYWTAAILSHLNIGHRHLLPIYAPMFVLCGAAATLRRARWTLCGLLALVAADTAWTYPNYIEYFNGLVRSDDAYRHLVDSSLDWGQELPAVSRYIESNPQGAPYYFSYFGMDSPSYYGVDARMLYSFGGVYLHGTPDLLVTRLPADGVDAEVARLRRERTSYDLMGVGQMGDDVYAVFLRKAADLRLSAGTYLISASMLQPLYFDETRGPWNARYEATYRKLEAEVDPLLDLDPVARAEAFRRYNVGALGPLLDRFEQYRLARLTSFLRRRRPASEINHAILVYSLTEADLDRELQEP